MNRRGFIKTAAGTSLAMAAEALAGTVEHSFDPVEQSIASLQRALAAGAITSETLTAAYLARIARFDQHGPEYRSVLALNPVALAAARTLDAERKANKLRGPLHGIPIIVKDNIETQDPVATTAGSLVLARSMRPADAAVVGRLRAAGAIVLGKANLSEWANFRSTHSSSGWSGVGGQTRNAYAPDRNPSGSSSGSAVAAAASFCAGAIGTETNGSIVSPASLNGLVGLKPTVGLVSTKGVVPISPRQDTPGPMCRTAADAAIMAGVIAERPLGFGTHGADLEAFRLRGLKIGAMPVPQSAHRDTARWYAEAHAALTQEGAVIVDLKPPSALDEGQEAELEALLFEFKAAINAYLATLDPAQVDCRSLTELIAFNRAHADEELVLFGQELFEMADTHGPLTDPAYQKALVSLQRTADTEGLAALLGQQGVEILISPSNGPAERLDEVWGDRHDTGFSQIASAAAIAGYPSLTMPAGTLTGLPVGMTLVGNRNQDGLLLQVARAYERATSARLPPRLAV
ncbi:MAG TPA: amidase [Steroidobacteraceae bacterium]|jgi:amidase|nr:amidase [Steroidobacteraceae bacterium]